MGAFKAFSATLFEGFPTQLEKTIKNPAMSGRGFLNNIFSLSCGSKYPNFALLGYS